MRRSVLRVTLKWGDQHPSTRPIRIEWDSTHVIYCMQPVSLPIYIHECKYVYTQVCTNMDWRVSAYLLRYIHIADSYWVRCQIWSLLYVASKSYTYMNVDICYVYIQVCTNMDWRVTAYSVRYIHIADSYWVRFQTWSLLYAAHRSCCIHTWM